jgi:hypothetical protein
MNTANLSVKLPYVVEEPLWLKILVIALIGLHLWFSTPFIDSFNEGDISVIFLMVI